MEIEWVKKEDRVHLNGDPGNYVCPHEVPYGSSTGIIYRIYLNGDSKETRNSEEVAKRRLVEMVKHGSLN